MLKKLYLLGLLTLLFSGSAYACPKIDGLVDFNCDGKHTVVATGDSIVYGRGDELYQYKGGYMPRLRGSFPKSRFIKLGYPGITTSRLFAFYRGLFRTSPKSPIIKSLSKADILIIDLGRNDYFNRNDPEITVRTLQQMASYFASTLKRKFKSAPLIVDSFLLPSSRGFDEDFINGINAGLLVSRSEKFPAYLRFDLMPPELLSEDGLHPSSAGYDVMAQIAAEYIRDGAQVRSISLRPDADDDGIYDLFERLEYKTDPKIGDSDGDGLKDGREVFTYKTDPLVADTDGDGIADGEEIVQGSNPLIAGG